MAGLTAITHAQKKAIEENYDFYFHLDDDDSWSKNHIEDIVNILKDYQETDFLFTRSCFKKNKKNKNLPKNYRNFTKIEYNNIKFYKESGICHSTWVINLNTLGNKLIQLNDKMINKCFRIKNKEIKEEKLLPGDYQFLIFLEKLLKDNKLKYIYNDNLIVDIN